MADDDDLRDLDEDTRQIVLRDRERWRAQIALARSRFSADKLIGMTVPEARAVVEAAGGEFATDDGPISAKLDSNRLIAEVVDGRITATSIG